MTILSDITIREQCGAGEGMIKPFSPKQHRTNEAGERIISWGLSSYGYDVRLADDEVKLFTNANSTIVDPMEMDVESCLVDAVIHGRDEGHPYFILPPNSYALGYTVEVFNIPRDISVIAVGKCLAGSTLITDPETGEIKRMDETEGIKSVQAVNDTATEIRNYPTEGLICNGKLPMVKVTTARGLELTATATHPLRTWKAWRPISELTVGDRIAVARHEYVEGKNVISPQEARLLGYLTADGQCGEKSGGPTFTKLDPVVMSAFIRDAETFGFHVSHRDEVSVRLVNQVGRRGGKRERNRAALWLEGHQLNVTSRYKKVPKAVQTATLEGVAEYLSALFTCDSYFGGGDERGVGVALEYYTTSELLARQVQILLRRFGLFFILTDKVKKLDGKEYRLFSLITSTPSTVRKFSSLIGFTKGSEKYLKLEEWLKLNRRDHHTNWDTLPKEAWADIVRIKERLGLTRDELGLTIQREQGISLPNLRKIAARIDDPELTQLANPDVVWDKIVKIEPDEEQLAYDYTVPEVHNFIANGIVVHNSTMARAGAIVNVTPIEAGFKGTVVIEIANASTLPIKIYLGVGIAQFLFFRGDRPCHTSYADRGGKYQGQKGVQTPLL